MKQNSLKIKIKRKIKLCVEKTEIFDIKEVKLKVQDIVITIKLKYFIVIYKV